MKWLKEMDELSKTIYTFGIIFIIFFICMLVIVLVYNNQNNNCKELGFKKVDDQDLKSCVYYLPGEVCEMPLEAGYTMQVWCRT
jgi:hypothetical protein